MNNWNWQPQTMFGLGARYLSKRTGVCALFLVLQSSGFCQHLWGRINKIEPKILVVRINKIEQPVSFMKGFLTKLRKGECFPLFCMIINFIINQVSIYLCCEVAKPVKSIRVLVSPNSLRSYSGV